MVSKLRRRLRVLRDRDNQNPTVHGGSINERRYYLRKCKYRKCGIEFRTDEPQTKFCSNVCKRREWLIGHRLVAIEDIKESSRDKYGV